ncbi:Hypothetical protein POVN_LOCUS282 [uncultured virus]|nr:Hypothetical protein POVN_LOCUS282 [uncultured virus]
MTSLKEGASTNGVSEECVKQIRTWIKLNLGKKVEEIFAAVILRIETDCAKTAQSLHELKGRSTKAKGDLFEAFCYLYLEALGYQVCTLKTLPQEKREHLRMPRNDAGIDLVAYTSEGPIAVQCKYRHCNGKATKWKPHGKTTITWDELSTFIALASLTGPWARKVVITNCDGVSWKGKNKPADALVLAKGTLTSTTREMWVKMAGTQGHVLGSQPVDVPALPVSAPVVPVAASAAPVTASPALPVLPMLSATAASLPALPALPAMEGKKSRLAVVSGVTPIALPKGRPTQQEVRDLRTKRWQEEQDKKRRMLRIQKTDTMLLKPGVYNRDFCEYVILREAPQGRTCIGKCRLKLEEDEWHMRFFSIEPKGTGLEGLFLDYVRKDMAMNLIVNLQSGTALPEVADLIGDSVLPYSGPGPKKRCLPTESYDPVYLPSPDLETLEVLPLPA